MRFGTNWQGDSHLFDQPDCRMKRPIVGATHGGPKCRFRAAGDQSVGQIEKVSGIHSTKKHLMQNEPGACVGQRGSRRIHSDSFSNARS